MLGSQAVFGRVKGYMDYTDPKTKHVFRGLWVRQGPESVCSSRSGSLSGTTVPSTTSWRPGSAPSLTAWPAPRRHLFVTRLSGHGWGSTLLMKEYKPDWVRATGTRRTSPVAAPPGGHQRGEITQQNLPGKPPLGLPRGGEPEFKEAMAANQVWPNGPPTPSTRRGADHRGRQAAGPRDLAALAGAFRPDPGPAAGHEGPLLRVQLGSPG